MNDGVKRKNRVVPIKSLIELSDRDILGDEDDTKDAFGLEERTVDEEVKIVERHDEKQSLSNMGGFNHLFDDEKLEEILRDGDRRKRDDQRYKK